MRVPRLLWPIIAGGLLLLGGWLTHIYDGPAWLRVSLILLSVVLTSLRTFPEAIERLKHFTLDVDVLMFAAALGASTLGAYEEGALLLFLFGLGHAGEELATGRSRRAIEALTHLAPEFALRVDADGQTQSVRLSEVAVDDLIRVKPFDRMPIDGEVVEGASDVDESSLTGESVPISKAVGGAVFAGTMNGAGMLIIRTTRLASDSTLSRIIKLVEDAQSQKSPTQLFTDKIERFYVPCVMILTLLLIILPPLFGLIPRKSPDHIWGGWFYQSMAFLTAASPCALAIGTPTAILCGIAHAARMGVLIKGGAHLETLGKIRAIAFDKTGTLTTGKPSVDRVVTDGSISIADAMRLAAAVDQHTSHPFAASIVNAARAAMPNAANNGHLPDVDDLVQLPGEGVRGRVEGRMIGVGKSTIGGPLDRWPAVLRESHVSMQKDGFATAIVTREGDPIAVIGLLDKPRDQAAATVRRLHEIGVAELSMLTGDHQAVAQNIATRLGIDRVHADLLPQQKLEIIDDLMKRHEFVAMIGDGVNDAPALAKASLGIAMGAAAGHGAADVAIETADVVLMGQDLTRLADGIELARKSRRIIKQNLTIALGVIGIVAPMAACGFAGLGWAVVLHEGSTVVVVLNSLRLLRK
jgi:Cd2+/Zn2+-exporting ATPase